MSRGRIRLDDRIVEMYALPERVIHQQLYGISVLSAVRGGEIHFHDGLFKLSGL